ncbi:Cytoplasmic tRNA 2-thiolation protein 2 [Gnomoniopsis smithogilvyi]|uniref:Cytoplasmic tRNA 2-thiolation protein 2 n=1 Tax=Gnomoniopsis smithogilvyi TaxID=1191159 RepID=A0A9W9CXN8_9PEZI|nr:Cytoplasmic tRNA 2-thiolation protein 2 [Gnomoniopsis smithogilvyi]
MDAGHVPSKLCRRCKENEATLKIRSEAICSECFLRYVNTKTVKRLEKLAGEIRAAPTQTKRVLVGLSFGPSSAALVDVLNDQIQFHLRKRSTAAFEGVVAHVDTDLSAKSNGEDESPVSQKLLDGFAARYPQFTFLRVPLSQVLELDTIDWAVLPAVPSGQPGEGASNNLRHYFDNLPSTTSKADMLRLFIRHLLIYTALKEDCRALVLGCSTTALAELTLGETAKGRGFSLPWMVGDGPITIQRFSASDQNVLESSSDNKNGDSGEKAQLSIYYPNRELFRNELARYTTLVEPPLTDLIPEDDAIGSAAVVSLRDVSIDEVMTRYFTEVEEKYPSIVANVVRTTAKLERTSGKDETYCGLCGMGLDELGDQRWKGEMGEDENDGEERLCYGCSRSSRG